MRSSMKQNVFPVAVGFLLVQVVVFRWNSFIGSDENAKTPSQRKTTTSTTTAVGSNLGIVRIDSPSSSERNVPLNLNKIDPTTLSETARNVPVLNDWDENDPMSSNQTTTFTVASKLLSARNNFGGVIARPFHPWPEDLPLPCYPPTNKEWHHPELKIDKSPMFSGFLFLKPSKAGSSTASSITLRIAKNVARRRSKSFPFCKASFRHGLATTKFPVRDKKHSFLWSILRRPTPRAVSMFFHFEVSRKNVTPTDENFQQFLLSDTGTMMTDNYYIKTLKMRRRRLDAITIANQILRDYNFIAIQERMDESLVALMMLLNLRMTDILHVSSKSSGGYDDGQFEETCTYIIPSYVSDGMDEFFKRKEWMERTKFDTALYEAANRSLDLTIEELGWDKFEPQLHLFQEAQALVRERCSSVALPCFEGTLRPPSETDCIWGDLGCGMTCLDMVAKELKLG